MTRRRRRRKFSLKRMFFWRSRRRSRRRRHGIPWIGMVALVLAVLLISGFTINGCVSKTKQVVDKVKDESVGLISKEGSDLTGRWIGTAGINEQKLALKRSQVNSELAKYIDESAKAYRSTEVDVDFKSDGSIRYSLTSSASAGRATGTWKVVSSEGDKVVIEVDVTRNDGVRRQSQMQIQFIDQGKHIAMVAPTGPELSDCEPIFVFRRATPSLAQIDQVGTQNK